MSWVKWVALTTTQLFTSVICITSLSVSLSLASSSSSLLFFFGEFANNGNSNVCNTSFRPKYVVAFTKCVCVCVRACVRACVRVCVWFFFSFLFSLFITLYIFLNLTTSLPQPVKFPGSKMHGRACKQYISRSFDTFAFNAVCFDEIPFRRQCEKEDKMLKGLQFCNFIGCFQVTSWQGRG